MIHMGLVGGLLAPSSSRTSAYRCVRHVLKKTGAALHLLAQRSESQRDILRRHEQKSRVEELATEPRWLGRRRLILRSELATQLRGEASERQVPRARIGLQQNSGGLIGLDDAVCSVMILQSIN